MLKYPYSRANVTKKDIKGVIEVLESQYLTQGEIVKNFDGDYLTESVVAFPSEEEGKAFVGQDAKDHLAIEPDRVIKEVKRDMGTDTTYPVAGKEHTPYGIS